MVIKLPERVTEERVAFFNCSAVTNMTKASRTFLSFKSNFPLAFPLKLLKFELISPVRKETPTYCIMNLSEWAF